MKKVVLFLIGFFAVANINAAELPACLESFIKELREAGDAYIDYGTKKEFNEQNYFNEYFIKNFDKCKKAMQLNGGFVYDLDAGGLKAHFAMDNMKRVVVNHKNANSTAVVMKPCILYTPGLARATACYDPTTFRTYWQAELDKCFVTCDKTGTALSNPKDVLNSIFGTVLNAQLCVSNRGNGFLFYKIIDGKPSSVPYAFENDDKVVTQLKGFLEEKRVENNCGRIIMSDNTIQNGFQIRLLKPIYDINTFEIALGGDIIQTLTAFWGTRLWL